MWKDRIRRKYRISKFSSRSVFKTQKFVKISKLSFLGIIALFIGLVVLLPVFAFNLPSPDKIVRKEGFSTKILDRNGKVLYDIFANQRRTPIKIDDVPEFLKDATIAIEDKNFYKHQGFDPTGYLRAVFNIFVKGRLQGGSTLTQQLVKNVLLSSERTVFRKIREFILSAQIERKYSKDQILQMYLNEVPYGGTAFGVESAAEIYFGKSVRDINLVESAILAGLPQRPSVYSPYSSSPKAYIQRTKDVLRRMREDDYIKKDQEKQALKDLETVRFQDKGASFKAPHFVQYVQKILEERYGEQALENGGLKVTTTLDLDLQEHAQKVVSEEIAKVESQRITNGAAVVINPDTGEILAMVGSKDFNAKDYDGQVNVTTSLRQPGSAFKPFTYVTAFKKGYTLASLIMDVPTTFPGGANLPEYNPVNYDGKFRGPIQLRFALGNSINIPAVKLLALIGVKDVLQTASEMGISSLQPDKQTLERVGLSLTLGGGEVRLLDLTSAYSSFLNKGFKIDPISILKVEDAQGKVLESVKPQKGKRVISEEQAYLISDILSDNKARADVFGTNSLLNIQGRQIAVKTGTTNDRRDNWTIGGNPQVIVGVWVGNNDNTPMLNVASGVSGASPIWRRIILESFKNKQNLKFETPGGIVSVLVDTISGFRAHDDYPSRSEVFIKGTEPGQDKVHAKLKVCKTDGKLASPSDISSGNYEEKEYYVFKENDPTGGIGGINKWQEAIDKWLLAQGDPKYHSPSEYCGTQNPISVEILEPSDKSSNLAKNFTIKIKAESTSDIVSVTLTIDEVKVKTFDKPPFNYDVQNLSDGVHTILVRATDANSKESEKKITVGVGVPWDFFATASPSPTPISTPTPNPT